MKKSIPFTLGSKAYYARTKKPVQAGEMIFESTLACAKHFKTTSAAIRSCLKNKKPYKNFPLSYIDKKIYAEMIKQKQDSRMI